MWLAVVGLFSLLGAFVIHQLSEQMSLLASVPTAWLYFGLCVLAGFVFLSFEKLSASSYQLGRIRSRQKALTDQVRQMRSELQEIFDSFVLPQSVTELGSELSAEACEELETVGHFKANLYQPNQMQASLTQTEEFGTTGFSTQVFTAAEVMGHDDVISTVREAVQKAEQLSQNRSPNQLRLTLTTPSDIHLPLAVRGEKESLSVVVFNLLEMAVASIGPAAGNVRVSVGLTLSAMTILIEDNGRGLSEMMLASRGWSDPLIGIRETAKKSQWQFEHQSRLGVGARVFIEIPRVDAFAHGSRAKDARFNYRQTDLNSQLA